MFIKCRHGLAFVATLIISLYANLSAAAPEAQRITATKAIIVAVAERNGIDPKAFLRMAEIESHWDPAAFHHKSRAAGIFQFIPATARAYGLSDPFDAQANAEAAAKLWKDNEVRLSKALGRKPSAGELYLAHQQGAGGAVMLLVRPTRPAASIVGMKALLMNGGRKNMTAREFANLWIGKFKGFE